MFSIDVVASAPDVEDNKINHIFIIEVLCTGVSLDPLLWAHVKNMCTCNLLLLMMCSK